MQQTEESQRHYNTNSLREQALFLKGTVMFITKAQRLALKRIYLRLEFPPPYKVFRRRVQPTFCMDGCVMVEFHTMWLGIEKDGYTHS